MEVVELGVELSYALIVDFGLRDEGGDVLGVLANESMGVDVVGFLVALMGGHFLAQLLELRLGGVGELGVRALCKVFTQAHDDQQAAE